MLSHITFLTALLFSAVYPLSFWISVGDPLKNHFHRFHLGLPCLVLSLTAIVYWMSPASHQSIKLSLLIWSIGLLLIMAICWYKESPSILAVTIISLSGVVTITKILITLGLFSPMVLFLQIIGACIFALSFYTMNLGHWYLNVPGLPLSHLKNSVYLFWSICALRAGIDILLIMTQKVFIQGDLIALTHFIVSVEGFLLILALVFGTLFPLICLYFVKGTLDVKSTQSATGILYAILCAVIIGDIAYKYYFLKYGVIL